MVSGANGRKMKIITRWIVSAEIIGLAPLIMIITLYNADLILLAAARAVHETRQFCFLRVSGISAWLKYQLRPSPGRATGDETDTEELRAGTGK